MVPGVELERQLRKYEKDLEVVKGNDLISDSPESPEEPAYQLDAADLEAWLSSIKNREFLARRGISRFVAIHSDAEEARADLDSSDIATGSHGFFVSSTTYSHLPITTDVFDVASGSRLARLETIAVGSENVTVGLLVILPIVLASEDDAFEESVKLMAPITAFVLMGGRVGWPSGFVHTVK